MKIIVVSNKKGGTGKTTTALNLCAGLGKRGYRVLGIDLDSQANFTSDSGTEPGSVMGSFDFIFNEAIEDCTSSTKYYDFLAADKRFDNERERFIKKGSDFLLKKALLKITDKYDFVVVDTPPDLNGVVFLALVAANYVVAVCEPDVRSIAGLADLTSSIESVQGGYNTEIKLTGILITKNELSTKANKLAIDAFESVSKSIDVPVFKSLIKNRTIYHQCSALHSNIYEVDERSEAAKEYDLFIDELLTII